MLFQRFWCKVKNNEGYNVTMKQQVSIQEMSHSCKKTMFDECNLRKECMLSTMCLFSSVCVSLLKLSRWARCISAGVSNYPVFYLFANETHCIPREKEIPKWTHSIWQMPLPWLCYYSGRDIRILSLSISLKDGMWALTHWLVPGHLVQFPYLAQSAGI